LKSKNNEQGETKISNIQNLAGKIWIGFPRRKKIRGKLESSINEIIYNIKLKIGRMIRVEREVNTVWASIRISACIPYVITRAISQAKIGVLHFICGAYCHSCQRYYKKDCQQNS
jgi:hypothetical protein